MDTDQGNLAKAEIGKDKNKQTLPKHKTTHPFLLLAGKMTIRTKVKIQEDSPTGKQQQLLCQRSKLGLSYVNTEEHQMFA